MCLQAAEAPNHSWSKTLFVKMCLQAAEAPNHFWCKTLFCKPPAPSFSQVATLKRCYWWSLSMGWWWRWNWDDAVGEVYIWARIWYNTGISRLPSIGFADYLWFFVILLIIHVLIVFIDTDDDDNIHIYQHDCIQNLCYVFSKYATGYFSKALTVLKLWWQSFSLNSDNLSSLPASDKNENSATQSMLSYPYRQPVLMNRLNISAPISFHHERTKHIDIRLKVRFYRIRDLF